ncbi:MAG: antibiotic biosynthesis monooxygenase [Thermoanaerobaculales bacterium]|nr:antibiotic biosynthesis monooxygenase [Thermoanaerobaculales bacterium]
MFMRFVNLKVKEGMLRDLARFYEDRVIPALQDSGGCLYASLLQPSDDDQECVSLTFWRSSEAAEAYEKSGAYDELLDDSDVFLAEVSEGRVQSSGHQSSAFPALQDPEVEAYPVEVAAVGEVVDAVGPQQFFVRIVSARIEAGRFEELKTRFDEEIKPALMATKGCRAVFLVENVKRRSRALSVTLWDSEEDAIRHELSGAFDEMVAKVSEFFSGLYQWRLSLGTEQDRGTVTGKDLSVRGFQVVTGRSLRD